MNVYVGELHSEVTATGGRPDERPDTEPLGVAEERWLQARGRAEWLAARVAAEGFDD